MEAVHWKSVLMCLLSLLRLFQEHSHGSAVNLTTSQPQYGWSRGISGQEFVYLLR